MEAPAISCYRRLADKMNTEWFPSDSKFDRYMRKFANAIYWCSHNPGGRHCDEILDCRLDRHLLDSIFPPNRFNVEIAGEEPVGQSLDERSKAARLRISQASDGGDLFLTPRINA